MWVRRIWDLYEWLFAKALGIKDLGQSSLIRVRRIKYHGRPLMSEDGTVLPGDPVLELHLNNQRLTELEQTPAGVLWQIRRRWPAELRLLAAVVASEERPVRGVVGTTLLIAAFRNLGFHVTPMPAGPLRSFWSFYMGLLERIYQPSGGRRSRPHRRRMPSTMWLTTGELQRMADSLEVVPEA